MVGRARPVPNSQDDSTEDVSTAIDTSGENMDDQNQVIPQSCDRWVLSGSSYAAYNDTDGQSGTLVLPTTRSHLRRDSISSLGGIPTFPSDTISPGKKHLLLHCESSEISLTRETPANVFSRQQYCFRIGCYRRPPEWLALSCVTLSEPRQFGHGCSPIGIRFPFLEQC